MSRRQDFDKTNKSKTMAEHGIELGAAIHSAGHLTAIAPAKSYGGEERRRCARRQIDDIRENQMGIIEIKLKRRFDEAMARHPWVETP